MLTEKLQVLLRCSHVLAGGCFLTFLLGGFSGATAQEVVVIDDFGSVGIGVDAPEFPLHVFRNSDDSRIAFFDQVRSNKVAAVGFRNNAPVSANNFCGFDFLLRDSVGSRLVSRFNCNLPVTNSAAATSAFGVDLLNNGVLTRVLTIRGNRCSIGTNSFTDLLRVLNATCNGATWNNACSRELKANIQALPAEAAREALKKLAPVTYAYKHEPEVRRVGFIAEDVPDLVAMPDRQSLCPMDLVAVLAKVTQEQEREIASLQARLAAQEQKLAAQEAAIHAILSRLSDVDDRTLVAASNLASADDGE